MSQRRSLFLVALVLTTGLGSSSGTAQGDLVGKVVGIQDGDTLTLLDPEDRQHRIRLAGIDAPEKGQPFGQVSRQHLGQLTFNRLVIARCPKVDRYGRDVCTLWVDGVDVSLAQLRAGLAWHFKRYAHEQPLAERDAYAQAEQTSRAARLGLWSLSEAQRISPWEWRDHARRGTRSAPERHLPLTAPLSTMIEN